MTVTGKATASVAGTVVASTDRWEVVEGNVYFPPESVDKRYFSPSSLTTVCPWKGTASYYDVVVEVDTDGKKEKKELPAAAWYYPHVKDAAREIGGYVAFCE